MTRSRIPFHSNPQVSAIPSVLQHLGSLIDPCHSNREIYMWLFYTFWSFSPIPWPFAFYPFLGYLMLHLADYWYDENDVENNDFSSISTLKELAAVSSTTEELGILSTVVMTCVVSLSATLDGVLASLSAMLTEEWIEHGKWLVTRFFSANGLVPNYCTIFFKEYCLRKLTRASISKSKGII